MDWRYHRGQFAAWPVRFLVFASGLIAITLIKANARLPSARAICRNDQGDTDNGHSISRQCHPTGARRTLSRTGDRTIRLSDLGDALRLGWEDFKAVPSHAIILCVIYPVLGLVLARLALGYSGCRCCFRSPPVLPCSPVRGARLYELKLSARARRRGVGLACDRGAALALVRRHARLARCCWRCS